MSIQYTKPIDPDFYKTAVERVKFAHWTAKHLGRDRLYAEKQNKEKTRRKQ